MTEIKQGIVVKVFAVAMGFCLLDLALAAEEQAVAYLSNQDGGVTVIGLDSLTKLGEFDGESKSPRGIGVTADGKYVLTANRDSGDMSVFDAATKKLVKRIAVGQNPKFIRVYGDHAYVTYEPSSKGGPPGQGEKDDDDDDGEKIPAGIAVVDLMEFKVYARS